MVIKLTAIFTFFCLLQVSAATYGQRLTLKERHIPMEQLFRLLQQESGYTFLYKAETLQDIPPVDIDIKNATINEILAQCFANRPLAYLIIDKSVVIKRTGTGSSSLPPSLFVVNGRVIDEKEQPIPGVTIHVKGTNQVISADANGEFKISVNSPSAILIFSAVGFLGMEIPVKNTGGAPIIVVLKESLSKLDEVQVIGYGTTSRRLSTGDVYSISAKDIEKQPVTNPLQALSGRIPGVLITETSGNPGSAVTVQIRGIGSLLSGTNPLYIVDGVPYLSEAIYTAGGNTSSSLKPAYGSSPLNAINPGDIESISVLKDADATAIYGSRGSNGVILITTKKGKAGKTKADVSFSDGLTSVSDVSRVKPLNLAQYLEIRRAAFANSGATPTKTNAPDLLVWDTTGRQQTDFEKFFIGKMAHAQDASVSFSGGNQQTNFLLSASQHHETGVVPGDAFYNKGSIHFTVEHSSLDKKFSAIISSSLVLDQGNNIGRVFQSSDMAGYVFSTAPNFPLYNSDGSLYWYGTSFTLENPLKYQYQVYTTKNNNLVGNITLRYSPIKDLNLKLTSSYNKITTDADNYVYTKGINPNSGTLPSAYFQQNISEIWNVEPQADYTRQIGRGRLNLLAGATFQNNTFNQPYYIIGANYTSDALLTNPQAAGSFNLYSFSSQYKYQSVFGRANYNWLDKYILNLNYRWDGSSKFGINNRYGSFASAGAAWIFSEADFFSRLKRVVSYGKLRVSYGSTGNDQIGNYAYMDTYSTYTYGYNGVSSVIPSRIANPDLKWEVNKKLEIAMDLGFFHDRILLSGAWFRNLTTNPLVSAPLTTVSGFSSYTANLNAEIQQEGTEFTLTSKNIQARNFSWSTNFNISFADSKLKSFKDFENTSYYYSMVLGNSMSSIYGFKYLGINNTTHLPYFLDANHNGTNSYSESYPAQNNGLGDYVYLGKTNPDFYGGINNSFSYKGFQLDVFVQFVGHVMRTGIMASAGAPGYNPVNMYSGVYDLFKATSGKIATRTASYTEGSAYESFVKYLQSDAVLSDAAYVRLKNISLSYNFSGAWLSKVKLSTAQVYLRGQNVFTVTNYKGLDPETGSSFTPPLKTVIAGVKLSF